MDKEIALALLTPRSGERNSRYLIPEGVSYNSMQLGTMRNQLERSENNRSGILFQCDARQLGGRMGKEYLFLFVPEFQRYSQSVREQCLNLLQDWFDNKRDAVIQAIDWSALSQGSMIPIPELTQLLNQIIGILPQSEINEYNKKNYFFNHRFIIMSVSTLTILLITTLGSQLSDWRPFRSGTSVQEQEQKLIGQLELYENLFQFPDGTIKPAIKNYKQDAFDELYRYCEKAPLNSVEEYLKDTDILSVKEQKRSNQYPIFGNVPEKDKATLLNNIHDISPVQLRRILAAYKKMQESLSSEPDNSVFNSKINNEYRIVFPVNEHAANLIVNPKGTAQPLFFVQAGSAKELEWAMTIHDFIFSIIKDEFGDEINSELSQRSLLHLIQTKTFNKSFNMDLCKSDEFRAAYEEFYSVLKDIAKEAQK